MDPDKHGDEKAAVIAAAGAAGFIILLVLRFGAEIHFLLAVVGGIAASFAYVFLAAAAVEAYLSLRSWAYRGRVTRPPDDQILLLAAFWPFNLFAGGLVFTLIGIINRRF